jgi:hypothetical protein
MTEDFLLLGKLLLIDKKCTLTFRDYPVVLPLVSFKGFEWFTRASTQKMLGSEIASRSTAGGISSADMILGN